MQSDTWNIYTGEQSFVFHFETETGCGSERMRFNARFRDALQVIQVYGMRRHEPQKRGGGRQGLGRRLSMRKIAARLRWHDAGHLRNVSSPPFGAMA